LEPSRSRSAQEPFVSPLQHQVEEAGDVEDLGEAIDEHDQARGQDDHFQQEPLDEGDHDVHPEEERVGTLALEDLRFRLLAGLAAGDLVFMDELHENLEATEAGESADSLSEDQVKVALRRVKDPEINLNIVDLGLVYGVAVNGRDVSVDMSLTSPGCPSGPEIMADAERELRDLPGVGDVAVNLVWSPPWTPERIEPRVRAYLGF
jgi:metal-sulfur cluster biosynthetic enzyme